ncbi:MAG: hypothetical protein H6839_14355 [Planctomycetes bacterium]|nr:hypothetical protein [Planctomycetota bacterium]
MSRYPNVRGKKDRGRRHTPTQPSPREADAKRFEAMQQAVAELYLERGGDRIDAAIKRADRLLALHDREAEGLLADEPRPHRWTVSPQMILRLQAEVERLQKRREELMEDCYQLVLQATEQYQRDGQPRAISPQELATAEAAPQAERSTAEAATQAT